MFFIIAGLITLFAYALIRSVTVTEVRQRDVFQLPITGMFYFKDGRWKPLTEYSDGDSINIVGVWDGKY